MTKSNFPQLLGLTTTDAALIEAVKANGGDVSTLSAKKVKELGSDFISMSSAGIVLSLVSRSMFELDHEREPGGDGPYVVTTAFHYVQGSDDVEPYVGEAPFANVAIKTREEALATYGDPARTKGDEGEVVWDQWLINELQLRVTYDDDQAITIISVSIPMV